jgi:hypothetical protein
MAAIHDAGFFEAEYGRLFETLADLAADIDIPLDQAEELINDVLLSTLLSRHINDVDAWVAAAFTSAVNHRGGRAS